MIMKKVFNSFFVIIAAMVTFAGCAKQEIDAPATPETKTVQFFANSIETKTAFGTPDGTTYPTLWNVGDKVKVLLNIEQVAGTEKIADVECEADLAESARFEVAFAPNTAPESYTYYAVCPSSAYNAKSSADGRITVIIPTDQTPLETTVDKDAQIIYAVAPADADQTSVDMDFHHLTSYGKFSLVNLTSEVSSVSQVKIVAPEDLYISGKWNYLVENGTISVHTKDMSNEITITTTQTENIWFSCGPVDVSGKTFKFIVTTDKGDLERTVTFPTGSKFESGTIKKFSLDMTDISVETPETPDTPENPEVTTQYYEKVTSAPADWSGKYLIVYEDGTNAYVFNGLDAVNGYVSAVISDGKIASTTDLENVSVNIESMEGGYSVKTSNGYIYGNASKNQLNFDKSTPKLNTISYSDNSVKITSGRVLSFNSASDQMRFRYYTDGSQKAIQLYKLAGSESGGEGGGETPVEKTLESISVSDAKTEYIVGDEFEKPTVTATYSDSSTEDVTAAAEFTGYDMAAAGTYAVTISYSDKTTTYDITVSAAQGGGDQPVEVVTYQHIITKKPSTGSVTLSDVIWTLDATNLNNYNSQNYAGVQFGTSSKTGTIKLTSENPFTYDGKSNVKEIRLWLNNGSGTITPTVTINGVECTMTGTIVKNSSAGSDYTKASLVKFTPTQPISGIVVIDLSCNKAGYFCAMEIDVQ